MEDDRLDDILSGPCKNYKIRCEANEINITETNTKVKYHDDYNNARNLIKSISVFVGANIRKLTSSITCKTSVYRIPETFFFIVVSKAFDINCPQKPYFRVGFLYDEEVNLKNNNITIAVCNQQSLSFMIEYIKKKHVFNKIKRATH